MSKKQIINVSLYERLKYKKEILFEFIEDINQALVNENKVNLLQDILIKKGVKKKIKKKKMSSIYKSQLSLNKGSNIDEDEDEDENEDEDDIFYGMFSFSQPLEKFVSAFKEKLEKFNTKNIQDPKFEKDKDNVSVYEEENDQINLEENDENPDKDTIFNTSFLIHEPHFKSIIRKVLLYKFQEMGIWARQGFGQENKKIYMLLKLQGKILFFDNNNKIIN